jgi:putative sterol carrier protein
MTLEGHTNPIRRKAMTSPTTQFFEQLERRGHEPLLRKATGVIRFEIVDNGRSERWIVAIDHGDIEVSHRNVAGDCKVRATRELFEQIASGEVNATVAMLRGAIQAEGDWRLLVLAQRLFRHPEEEAVQG